MWSELLTRKIKDKDGNEDEIDVLVLDTEGLNSPSRSFDVDVKLFTLTVLLSSTLVYNQKGPISDESFENLNLIQMLPTEVKYKHLKESSDQDFQNLFPDFLWVLHDFSLTKTFKHCTAESYL